MIGITLPDVLGEMLDEILSETILQYLSQLELRHITDAERTVLKMRLALLRDLQRQLKPE
jgi:hypothetical protein